MRVLIVSTSETVGGAAIAASRLTDALNQNGVEARMLVRDRQTDRPTTIQVKAPCWIPRFMQKAWRLIPKARERLSIFMLTGSKSWDIDTATDGFSFTSTKAFRKADVIHLHWVNQGMVSLEEVGRILKAGKPVVWTLHDLWPVMALHHYGDVAREMALTEERTAAGILARWEKAYSRGHITFVGCSRWIADEARRSTLAEGHEVVSIPNPFPASIFLDKTDISRSALGLPEDKHLVLFCAQKTTDERKGIKYLLEACQKLKDEDVALAVVGASMPALDELPLPVYHLGYISSPKTMAAIYTLASVFVTPSLEDNLPNTIMEAMACGTPCVGFRVGGIPEMIDHKQNGYVAAHKDATDLAEGIRWTLRNREECSRAAQQKAVSEWGEENVARRFISLYETAIRQSKS